MSFATDHRHADGLRAHPAPPALDKASRWRLRRRQGRRAARPRKRRAQSGQTTVEAAFALPIVFLLILMLVQPAIVLYDRIVMENAAAESCRMLATAGDAERGEVAEEYVRRRLAAIPQAPWFHVHDDACSYTIALDGDETASSVSVSITNELVPLPLIDGAATLLGVTNGAGHWELSVEQTLPTQTAWAAEAIGGTPPSTWIGTWADA